MSENEVRLSDLLATSGPVDLSTLATDATPGFTGDKKDGEQALAELGSELADLQERLWAGRTAGDRRSVLLVLQGMDTSGKGGVLRHSVGLVDPQGVRIAAFKAPSEDERRHDFLWRIRKQLPEAGFIGVFDRSHYEDVLIQRVRGFAPADEIEGRYGAINDFEAELVANGATVIKCMLHIGPDEQKQRLLERLDNPTKHWKYNPGDVDERELWPAYREAYEIALDRTSTEQAPWHVVPADKKWYRNWAVARLLLEALRGLDPVWPEATFDPAVERDRLLNEAPVR